MTYLKTALLASAFAKVTQQKETAFLSPKTPGKIDYSDPSVCPYCHKPMVRSNVRTMSGQMEPVFLCREDRAVGAVPDSMIDVGG
jgi:hypothetical protein